MFLFCSKGHKWLTIYLYNNCLITKVNKRKALFCLFVNFIYYKHILGRIIFVLDKCLNIWHWLDCYLNINNWSRWTTRNGVVFQLWPNLSLSSLSVYCCPAMGFTWITPWQIWRYLKFIYSSEGGSEILWNILIIREINNQGY